VTASKPFHSRLPASRARCLREVALVWRGGWLRLRSRLVWILLVVGLGLAAAWCAGDADMALLNRVCSDGNATATRAAKVIRDYSDLVLCTPLALTLWIVGVVWRRGRWRRLGVACLMAALMAGAIVIAFKHAIGRPRPNKLERFPGVILHGPTTDSKLHSFPSGHTATSTATGVAMIAAAPAMAVPGLVYAATVGWSRMQLRDHYPLDVVVGGFIGLMCGACFASAVPGSCIRLPRRKRRRVTF
jgi:membrane-associated phospholipid phosphatase